MKRHRPISLQGRLFFRFGNFTFGRTFVGSLEAWRWMVTGEVVMLVLAAVVIVAWLLRS